MWNLCGYRSLLCLPGVVLHCGDSFCGELIRLACLYTNDWTIFVKRYDTFALIHWSWNSCAIDVVWLWPWWYFLLKPFAAHLKPFAAHSTWGWPRSAGFSSGFDGARDVRRVRRVRVGRRRVQFPMWWWLIAGLQYPIMWGTLLKIIKVSRAEQ